MAGLSNIICELKYAKVLLESVKSVEKQPNRHLLICPKLGLLGSTKMRKKESKSQNNNKNTYFLKSEVFSWKNVKFLTNEAEKMKRFSSESDSDNCSDEKHAKVEVIKSPMADVAAHDKKFPFFRRPRAIGHFSVNSDRKYVADRSQMMFFCPERLRNSSQAGSSYKRVDWDLNQGMEHVIRKDQSFKKDEGISMMLKWILDNKKAFEIIDPKTNEAAPLQSLSTDFVCFRGLCTTIMCTPYEKRDGWQLFAVKHKGTIYLRQMDTEAQLKAEANKSDHQLRMASWGYKFEQYVLDDLRKEREESFNENRKLPPVNENEEFCCLFRTRLGQHSVVYGAEMDGFRLKSPSEGPLNPDDIDLNQDGHFIELKTTRVIDSPRLEAR